jgi:iron only hydrogenase large subunit-like protein
VKKQYDELCDDGNMTSSFRPAAISINLLIEKHYPEASKYLADVLSPMLAHGKDIKKRHPEAKVIFFGPCISKKNEVEMYPGYDEAPLTFLELERWLAEKKRGSFRLKTNRGPSRKSKARLFPIEGGILATMAKDNPNFTYLSIGGMDEAIAAIEDIPSGNVHHAFIEMSSCSNSCINGPAMPKERQSPCLVVCSRQNVRRDLKILKVTPRRIARNQKSLLRLWEPPGGPSEGRLRKS